MGGLNVNNYNPPQPTGGGSKPPPPPIMWIVIIGALTIVAIVALSSGALRPSPPERERCQAQAWACQSEGDPNAEALTSFFDRCTMFEHHSPGECLSAWDKVHPELPHRKIFGVWPAR